MRRALHELTAEGAKTVAFDVLFAETRADHPLVIQPDGTTIESDDYFADELKRSGNVILGADQDLVPTSLFFNKAWRVGNISVDRDRDGVLRRAQAYRDYRVWDPFLEIMAKNNGVNLARTRIETNQIVFVRRRANEEIVFPLDKDGLFSTTNLYPSSFDREPG